MNTTSSLEQQKTLRQKLEQYKQSKSFKSTAATKSRKSLSSTTQTRVTSSPKLLSPKFTPARAVSTTRYSLGTTPVSFKTPRPSLPLDKSVPSSPSVSERIMEQRKQENIAKWQKEREARLSGTPSTSFLKKADVRFTPVPHTTTTKQHKMVQLTPTPKAAKVADLHKSIQAATDLAMNGSITKSRKLFESLLSMTNLNTPASQSAFYWVSRAKCEELFGNYENVVHLYEQAEYEHHAQPTSILHDGLRKFMISRLQDTESKDKTDKIFKRSKINKSYQQFKSQYETERSKVQDIVKSLQPPMRSTPLNPLSNQQISSRKNSMVTPGARLSKIDESLAMLPDTPPMAANNSIADTPFITPIKKQTRSKLPENTHVTTPFFKEKPFVPPKNVHPVASVTAKQAVQSDPGAESRTTSSNKEVEQILGRFSFSYNPSLGFAPANSDLVVKETKPEISDVSKTKENFQKELSLIAEKNVEQEQTQNMEMQMEEVVLEQSKPDETNLDVLFEDEEIRDQLQKEQTVPEEIAVELTPAIPIDSTVSPVESTHMDVETVTEDDCAIEQSPVQVLDTTPTLQENMVVAVENDVIVQLSVPEQAEDKQFETEENGCMEVEPEVVNETVFPTHAEISTQELILTGSDDMQVQEENIAAPVEVETEAIVNNDSTPDIVMQEEPSRSTVQTDAQSPIDNEIVPSGPMLSDISVHTEKEDQNVSITVNSQSIQEVPLSENTDVPSEEQLDVEMIESANPEPECVAQEIQPHYTVPAIQFVQEISTVESSEQEAISANTTECAVNDTFVESDKMSDEDVCVINNSEAMDPVSTVIEAHEPVTEKVTNDMEVTSIREELSVIHEDQPQTEQVTQMDILQTAEDEESQEIIEEEENTDTDNVESETEEQPSVIVIPEQQQPVAITESQATSHMIELLKQIVRSNGQSLTPKKKSKRSTSGSSRKSSRKSGSKGISKKRKQPRRKAKRTAVKKIRVGYGH